MRLIALSSFLLRPLVSRDVRRRGLTRVNVGVLELISFTVPPEWQAQRAESLLRRHLHSLMPQVVSCWARRLGHNVHYATYHGQADPLSLLPKELDFVFVSASTQARAC